MNVTALHMGMVSSLLERKAELQMEHWTDGRSIRGLYQHIFKAEVLSAVEMNSNNAT